MDDPRAKVAAKATRNNEFGFSLPFAFTKRSQPGPGGRTGSW